MRGLRLVVRRRSMAATSWHLALRRALAIAWRRSIRSSIEWRQQKTRRRNQQVHDGVGPVRVLDATRLSGGKTIGETFGDIADVTLGESDRDNRRITTRKRQKTCPRQKLVKRRNRGVRVRGKEVEQRNPFRRVKRNVFGPGWPVGGAGAAIA